MDITRASIRRLISAALIALLGGSITACAMLGKSGNQGIEKDLLVAGFARRLADTPEKLAYLRGLPQRELVARGNHGAGYYVYADAEHCKCMYEGGEQAYRRYLANREIKTQKAPGGMR